MSSSSSYKRGAYASPLRQQSLKLMLACMLSVVSGCSIYRDSVRDVDAAVDNWRRERLAVVDNELTDNLNPNAAPPTPRLKIEPAESLGNSDVPLAEFIHTALKNNPAIKTAVSNLRLKLERIPQVTSLPDPVLRAVYRPEQVQTAVGDVYFTLGFAQKIPFPPRLERAGRVAAAEVRMSIERLNAARFRVIADVERAYLSMYLMDRYIELSALNRSLLEDLEQVVTARYEVGGAPQRDVLRIQTAVAEIRNDEHRYALRRQSAAAALNQAMDAPLLQEHAKTHLLDWTKLDIDAQTLVQLAEDHNPDLAALREQLDRDREQLRLANLGYWPDLTLGFEWNYLQGRNAFVPPPNPQTGVVPPYNRASENGDDNWAITLQMNLPIWTQRIEAAKRQARHAVTGTMHEQRVARNLVAFRVVDAHARVETQIAAIELLNSTLIPQTRQIYEVTLAAYQVGETDFRNVVDSWRRLLDFELMLHRETVDLELAYSDLRKEVGLVLAAPTEPSQITQE